MLSFPLAVGFFLICVFGYSQQAKTSRSDPSSTVVTTLLDNVDETDGLLSLREAIDGAVSGQKITFDKSLKGGTIDLNGDPLSITKGLTIDATSAGGITIDACRGSRVFFISGEDPAIPVELKGLTITGGNIINNDCGSGIYNEGALLVITDSTITGNTTEKMGGGIFNGTFRSDGQSYGGRVTIRNSTVSGNSAIGGGGGIMNSDECWMTITDSTVTGNSAGVGGGVGNIGGKNDIGGMMIANSVIVGNAANGGGGGIRCTGITKIVNSTVSGNSAGGEGGGIYCTGTTTMTNTIVAINRAESHNDVSGLFFDFNNLVGLDPDFAVAPAFESGKLVNPDELDLSLKATSPAIDKGDNGAVESKTDLAGEPRIFGGNVDLGAYECQEEKSQAPPIVVTTLDDGEDRGNVSISLRQAIKKAKPGDVITFDDSLENGTIKLGWRELKITKSVTIDATSIGGITIDGNGESGVFSIETESEKLVELIGLTITGGRAESGGGIFHDGGRLTVKNSTITGNSSDSVGGGIRSHGILMVDNTEITENASGKTEWGNGGGIAATQGLSVIRNSTISENTAEGKGGGICADVKMMILGSTISGNTANGNDEENGKGGGVCTHEPLMVTNSTISGNTAEVGGGIYTDFDETARIINSTISGNTADRGGGICGGCWVENSMVVKNAVDKVGGGIYGPVSALNATISGNTAGIRAGGIFDDKSKSGSIFNSIISLNSAAHDDDYYSEESGSQKTYGYNIVGTDPGFVTPPVFQTRRLMNPDEADFTLKAGSPAVDKGFNDIVTTETDLAGNPRIVGRAVDIGAYEFQRGRSEKAGSIEWKGDSSEQKPE